VWGLGVGFESVGFESKQFNGVGLPGVGLDRVSAATTRYRIDGAIGNAIRNTIQDAT